MGGAGRVTRSWRVSKEKEKKKRCESQKQASSETDRQVDPWRVWQAMPCKWTVGQTGRMTDRNEKIISLIGILPEDLFVACYFLEFLLIWLLEPQIMSIKCYIFFPEFCTATVTMMVIIIHSSTHLRNPLNTSAGAYPSRNNNYTLRNSTTLNNFSTLRRLSDFLSQSKNMHFKLIRDSKLSIGTNVGCE